MACPFLNLRPGKHHVPCSFLEAFSEYLMADEAQLWARGCPACSDLVFLLRPHAASLETAA